MDTLKIIQERKGVAEIHSKDNPRAAMIRSKLIQDFNLLDHLQGLIINDPKYNMNDIKDPKKLNKLMIEDPLQLVRFDFNPVRNVNVSSNHRQRNCLQNRYVKYPPLNMWAQWILESSFFRNLILYLIIINSIVFGVLVDVSDKPAAKFSAITTMLVIIDWCILSVLTSEIILRWLHDFVHFWRSSWNVFDLTVLITSIVPEVVKGTHLKTSIELHFLKVIRIFRALRSLKMMRTFHQVRLILLAMTKAFEAMTFILLLVLIFAYVFAVVGVLLFRSYTESDDPDLGYRSAFRRLSQQLSLKDVLSKVERPSESEINHSSDVDFRSSSLASHSSELSFKRTSKDWEGYVRKNIKLMKNNSAKEKVIWPRDSLFHYYELLEQLQYNLGERKKLQLLAAQALLNMHDV
ncbi:cation channel sperm-associated protein 2-like isoform X3 [Heterodontus francisci]|uniref:cation channel sperm-associated protein 2-like isoform X3 n=1 Tax=Heterodontus francisci TaxID=7792 RepID=UPI00355C5D03